jgi:hypothetical protein
MSRNDETIPIRNGPAKCKFSPLVCGSNIEEFLFQEFLLDLGMRLIIFNYVSLYQSLYVHVEQILQMIQFPPLDLRKSWKFIKFIETMPE